MSNECLFFRWKIIGDSAIWSPTQYDDGYKDCGEANLVEDSQGPGVEPVGLPPHPAVTAPAAQGLEPTGPVHSLGMEQLQSQ